MEPKRDCFAFGPKMEKCTALDKTYCKEGKCSFYKTKAQRQAELEAEGRTEQDFRE